MKKYYWIYVLECADGSYYTGITNNCERRLLEHENGRNPRCYTFSRRPVRFAYSECFDDVWEAIGREKQIKRWTRRKKEALIREQHETLPQHASCMNLSHSATKAQRQRIEVVKRSMLERVMVRLRSP